jgi:hypothetical protein
MSPSLRTATTVVEPIDHDAAWEQKLADTPEAAWDRLAARVRADIAAGRARPMPNPNPTYPQVILGLVERLVADGVPLDHIRIPDLGRQGILETSAPAVPVEHRGTVWVSDDFNDPLEEFADYM